MILKLQDNFITITKKPIKVFLTIFIPLLHFWYFVNLFSPCPFLFLFSLITDTPFKQQCIKNPPTFKVGYICCSFPLLKIPALILFDFIHEKVILNSTNGGAMAKYTVEHGWENAVVEHITCLYCLRNTWYILSRPPNLKPPILKCVICIFMIFSKHHNNYNNDLNS